VIVHDHLETPSAITLKPASTIAEMRNEIARRLSFSAAGAALMRYPHFIGTIHAFVNEFLAVPWLRSKGYPILAVDTQIALAKRKSKLEWKWRKAMEMRGLTDRALTYDKPDFSGGPKGDLSPNTAMYQALVSASRQASQEGYFCFDEMFVWANELLDRRPGVATDLRHRFPMVFIDEAQDNSEEQAAILYRVFCEGNAPSIRQRFGDSNQAIYAHNNQLGARTDPFPSGATHSIPRSYRFSQTVADVVKGFGVVPQDLIGAGPSGARVQSPPRQSVLFLFDDQSVREVLPRYGAHLIETFEAHELANGLFTAVAGVHELDAQGPIPHAMGHYAPDYDPACNRKESAPATFFQYLARARFEMGDSRNAHFLINALASAVFRLGELEGVSSPARGRKSAHRRMIEIVEGGAAYRPYLELVDKALIAMGDFTKAQWVDEILPRIQVVAGQLTGVTKFSDDVHSFLDWDEPTPFQDRDAGDMPQRLDNLFRYPADSPRVNVRLGSIHSVKGETHTATLVLDSYFHKHHLGELKPWLLGARSGGLKQKKKGKPEYEGVRMLGRLKLHYVAMTRPTHLLCVAMRQDAFDGGELKVLETRGWRIVDCRPIALTALGESLHEATSCF
jgi:hypothetical protein